MGQKTHPIGFRLGIIKTWNSRWFAPDRFYAQLVYEDMMVKKYIDRRLDNAGIARVNISRAPKKITVDIHTSRPGIVIGRKGAEVDKLRSELQLLTKKDILLNIVEVRKPELDARLVADNIARQLEGRISFRRAMKKSIAATMKMGAVGIKIQCAGRLGGAEIARTEKYKDGRIPLHTIRADIDYSTARANTTYGVIGVKVWICRGEILEVGQFYNDKEDKQDSSMGGPQEAHSHKRPRRPGDRGKRPRGKVRRHDGRPGGGGGGSRPAPSGRRPDAKPQAAAPAPAPAKKAETKAPVKKAEVKAPAKKAETKEKKTNKDSE